MKFNFPNAHLRRQSGNCQQQRETSHSKIRISSHSEKGMWNIVIPIDSCRKCIRQTCPCSPTQYCECERTRKHASMQLLAATKQNVLSTDDSPGTECTPETYFHRIVVRCMMNGLAVCDKPHRSDEPGIQNATIIGDFSGQDIGSSSVLGSVSTWKFDKWETEKPTGNWDHEDAAAS